MSKGTSIFIDGRPATVEELEQMCRRAASIVTVLKDSNFVVSMGLNEDKFCIAKVTPSAELYGVQCHYIQDMAAFCERSNPRLKVIAETESGHVVPRKLITEAKGQW